jgi:hypothetical protein
MLRNGLLRSCELSKTRKSAPKDRHQLTRGLFVEFQRLTPLPWNLAFRRSIRLQPQKRSAIDLRCVPTAFDLGSEVRLRVGTVEETGN